MSAPESLPEDVLVALRDGRKIEAIKRLRRARGIGLKEARQLVEAHPQCVANVPRSSGGGLLILAAVLLLLGWMAWRAL